jgi:hypothetical protein
MRASYRVRLLSFIYIIILAGFKVLYFLASNFLQPYALSLAYVSHAAPRLVVAILFSIFPSALHSHFQRLRRFSSFLPRLSSVTFLPARPVSFFADYHGRTEMSADTNRYDAR